MSAPTTETRHLLGRDAPAVERCVDEYLALHDERRGGDAALRKRHYATLVNDYYDLATDFYELGWGQSFHFAPRRRGEGFLDSLARHERFLCYKLGLGPGMMVLDVGCGVGGPMREIARRSGCTVVGVNNNDYQIRRAEAHNRRAGVSDRCRLLKADFMALPAGDESFDAAYAIEATCHAPDRTALFRELWRVLKPGAELGGYEWCMTGGYRPVDPEHRRIKQDIERGDGLPDLTGTDAVDEALGAGGFELLEARDLAGDADPETPWYYALGGDDYSLGSLPRARPVRWLTNWATRALERIGVAPRGTTEVSRLLNRAADALVEGGRRGIFTPMYFFRARKPRPAAAAARG
jgi:sterol 24-C-methyltransferase